MFDGLFVVNDWLDAILLGGFFFGLVFTSFSLAVGALDIGGGHIHGHGSHGHGHGHGHGGHAQDIVANIFNVGTILAFVTWFGGCSYLLRNGAGIPAVISLMGGLAGGIFGGYVVIKVLTWLKDQEGALDERLEQLQGSSGRITSPIRAGGVGEIVYELNGVRQVSAARALEEIAIPRGANVVIVRRERGIAYVEPLHQLSEDEEWERRFAIEANSSRPEAPP
jgi:hypothetical protein